LQPAMALSRSLPATEPAGTVLLLTSLGILVPQADLPVAHWNLTPCNEDLLHIGFHVQRVAVRNHDIGGFADVEGTELVGDAPDFGGVEGDRLERFIIGEAEGGCESRLV